jgi:tetratricopeptide (TPR) repeat protein
VSSGAHDVLFGMARAHQQAGENEEAAAYFRRCLAIRPIPGTWLSLGQCLLNLGQLDAGYDCLRRAVHADPKRYGHALVSMLKPARGRFWLRPSAAARFFEGEKN